MSEVWQDWAAYATAMITCHRTWLWINTIAIVVLAVAVIVVARRKPKQEEPKDV